jgi:soluble lytic murein transglycosylase-like protein
MPEAHKLNWLGSAPKRERPDSAVKANPVAAALHARLLPLVKADQPAEAEAMLEAAADTLDPASLAELRYIVAWSWYQEGNDAMARAVAGRAMTGAGPWAVQANWIVGLASWRQQDCQAASAAFSAVARGVGDKDLRAAGNFWSARSDLACGKPQGVQARMRLAAAESESFYGLLAAQYLGLDRPVAGAVNSTASSSRDLMRRPNVWTAAALVDIGETELAERLLRHQAKIGAASDHTGLIAMAAQLNLPNTQLWLSQNGPAGARINASVRYPVPGWNPANGWRVDRSLLLAHSLQESNFRPTVVSPAGAQGLMQLMPGTAAIIARRKGESIDRQSLKQPSINMEYGQSYIEELRDFDGINGMLPKVIAAYNAGPGAVKRWNTEVADKGDPLLYVESIPYWETRGYVMIVLRNYWMYQRLDNKPTPSLSAMAQGMWPRFPGMPGQTAMRMTTRQGRTTGAD